MTHTQQLPESAGALDEEKPTDRTCPKCGAKTCVYSVWESSCGGYEDEKHSCTTCEHVWWIDGPDA